MYSNKNSREHDISEFVDKIIPNDNINILIEKYKDELKDYTYIDTVGTFSILVLKGSMKYINKYDLNLRSGGLVTKIYNKEGKWYAIIKKMNKNFYVSFDNNYIFYLDCKAENIKKWAQCFISDVDNGLYDID